MPDAPATIVRTSASWPGTSTTETRARRRQRERREAELDRDAARLLLRQAVGVDAGQRAHERGLAVVDVSGGAEHVGASAWISARANPSRPKYGRSAFGIRIEPSARWWFSSSAISAREIATAVPFSVCTSSFFLAPLRRKRVFEPARLEVGAVRGARHLAPVAALAATRQPGLDVELAIGGRAEIAGRDVDHAVRDLELLPDALLDAQQLRVHRLGVLRAREREHLDLRELVHAVEALALAAGRARLGAVAVRDAGEPDRQLRPLRAPRPA